MHFRLTSAAEYKKVKKRREMLDVPDMFFQVSPKTAILVRIEEGRATHTFKDLANAVFFCNILLPVLYYLLFLVFLGSLLLKCMPHNTVFENFLKKSLFARFSQISHATSCTAQF